MENKNENSAITKEVTTLQEDIFAFSPEEKSAVKRDVKQSRKVIDGLNHLLDSKNKGTLQLFIGDDKKKAKLGKEIDMMSALLEVSPDNIEKLLDDKITEMRQRANRNKRNILKAIKEHEQMLLAVNLFFRNAGSGGEVENAEFMLVNPQYFAGQKDAEHFDVLCKELKDRFYARQLKKSPSFIAYLGDIANGALKLSEISEETVAFTVCDLPFIENKIALDDIIESDETVISGIGSNWASLGVSNSWILVRDAYDENNKKVEKDRKGQTNSYEGLNDTPLFAPSSGAIIAKLLNNLAGYEISGFYKDPIDGGFGAAFATDTRDDANYGDKGIITIDNEGGVKIFTDSTANLAKDNDNLTRVSKMTIYNKILKDMVGFCNKNASSRIDENQLQQKISTYIKTLVRKGQVKADPGNKVQISRISPTELHIDINVKLFDTTDKFFIQIGSTKKESEDTK